MLKKVLNLLDAQVLSKKEQTNVIGGQPFPRRCDEENPCNTKGLCCTNNYCINSGPDKNGIWPRCDSM